MTTANTAQLQVISLKRYTFFAIVICYLPHITTEPWWLFGIFLSALSYRLLADYFYYPPLPRWIRFMLVLACLALLNSTLHSSGFVIRFLLTFIILKSIETTHLRDIKVLVLCNFLLIFSALIVIQELWMMLYLLIAILVNLSIMLKLTAPHVSLRQISGKSSQQLLLVIPLSIILFYIFPRIDPLWQVPVSSKGIVGFSETMHFGSIAELASDDSLVMQITFKHTPIVNGYWRGAILNFYSGESWYPSWYNHANFAPLPGLNADDADYEIILEPDQSKWLFYEGYPIAGGPSLQFSPDHGLMRQNKEAISQRLGYQLKLQAAPYHALSPTDYAEATQLPSKLNPRLQAWAHTQFNDTHQQVRAFIRFLQDYIHQQPFWYTLTPPLLNDTKDQMDRFWFETQRGFCEHYASAVTVILRTVGIPARVVVGYQGGQWNPIAQAISIQHNDAHAWLEYWQAGSGWQRLDPTTFIATERIDQSIRNNSIDQQNALPFAQMPWAKKLRFISESFQLFSQRWFLFYNQTTQQNLLDNLGLGQWDSAQLLQAAIACMIVFFILIELIYQWRQKRRHDALLTEYHLLQTAFRQLQVTISPSATLQQQCQSLADHMPMLATTMHSFLQQYEDLRLKHATANKTETITLFKSLRRTLHQYKFHKKINFN